MKKPITHLALDIEGTLVTHAGDWYPRPHLYEFLEFCYHSFPKVCFFTMLRHESALQVITALVEANQAPKVALEKFDYVVCTKNYKDLFCVNGVEELEQILLVDDLERNLTYDQKSRWIPISSYDPFYQAPRFSAFGLTQSSAPQDQELLRVKKILEDYL